jgi:hypothetical protein
VNRASRRALARAFRPPKPRKRNGTPYHRPYPLSLFANALPKGRVSMTRLAKTNATVPGDVVDRPPAVRVPGQVPAQHAVDVGVLRRRDGEVQPEHVRRCRPVKFLGCRLRAGGSESSLFSGLLESH